MSNEINIEKLREEVNPVYGTAQSCLQIIAALGDADSEELRKKLGFTAFGEDPEKRTANIPPDVLAALMKVMPAFHANVEARFCSTNNFISGSGAKQVLDLPCGYTSRGIKLEKSGIRYFGTDLPAVIDAMRPAVKQVIGDSKNVSYHEVDATNYSSLRKALEGADGEILITTEGMLMYLTQAEVETVFGNIRRLLLEFGGKWITLDNELDDSVTDGILSGITAGMAPGEATKLSHIAAGALSKTTMTNNVFFDKDKEKAKKFVSDMGFELELVPITGYIPEKLSAFAEMPDDNAANAKKAFDRVNYWVMTAKPGTVDKFACDDDNFRADVKLADDMLNVSLAGRLDTITAPELLSLYRDAEAKGSIASISVDMKELGYISSAGLRVLLIMRKAVKSEKEFSLINMNETIAEIISTTGFDTIFC